MVNKRTIVLFASAAVLASSSIVTAQRFGSGPTPRQGVCFYVDSDYRGDYFCAASGETLKFVPDGMNDRISSIRVFGNAEVTIYKDDSFRGASERYDGSVRNLHDQGWNDRVSSFRVRNASYAGRGNGGGGHSSSLEDPDKIVRRAYEDILDREPDTAGLRIYRSHIIDDGWTEAQVRDALRKSPEYREKTTITREQAEEIVRRAYLAVLNREPDSGSRGYVDKVLRDKWKQPDVERELRKSPEYRNKKN